MVCVHDQVPVGIIIGAGLGDGQYLAAGAIQHRDLARLAGSLASRPGINELQARVDRQDTGAVGVARRDAKIELAKETGPGCASEG